MPYVDRDPVTREITGEYRAPQRDGHEFVAEDALEWQARDLDAAKTARKAAVNAECRRRASLGAPVTLSGARTFTVQTRDTEDKLNLLGMGKLIELLEAASPGAIIAFRDAANVVRPLAQADVLALLAQVGAAQQALIAAGWDHKDAIEALATQRDVDGYDISVGWP